MLSVVALVLCLTCPATAEEWALFEPPTAVMASYEVDEGSLPSIALQSFQILPPPADDDGLAISLTPEEVPRPMERLPRPPGQAPPPPPEEGVIPGASIDNRDQPLTLCEVLESVMRHYPLLLAVERERGIAAGRLTSAMGAFDTNVNGSGNALAPGTYENYRSDFGMAQLLPYGGISMFGCYRTGFGDFPTYNLKQLTADAGEFRGGLTVPLAKNRDIDAARAGRAQAQIDISLAEPAIERSRLDYMRAAARSYWNWLGSGERRTAAEFLVDLAAERDLELALRVQGGAIANIERLDNQQNIALRQGLVVKADRSVQEAAIGMSLFHRDESGQPLIAGKKRLRPAPQPLEPTPAMFQESLSRALARRPEFQRLALQRERLLVDRRLANNQTLPGLDAQIVGNQDAGFGKRSLSGVNGLDRQVLEAALVFQMPAQRRDARGRLQAIHSQLVQLDKQLQYAEDQIRAEVQDAYSLLERAYAFYEQVSDQVELATLVARAEREQLRLGRSDVLRVTLREQTKFDASLLEIMARQEFWRADSDLRAADTSLGPETCGFDANMLACPPCEPK